jgi:hypothetical protein
LTFRVDNGLEAQSHLAVVLVSQYFICCFKEGFWEVTSKNAYGCFDEFLLELLVLFPEADVIIDVRDLLDSHDGSICLLLSTWVLDSL